MDLPFISLSQVGEWRFEIVNLADREQLVTVSVQSQSRDGDEPIVTNARWGLDDVQPPDQQMLYVTVSKGEYVYFCKIKPKTSVFSILVVSTFLLWSRRI